MSTVRNPGVVNFTDILKLQDLKVQREIILHEGCLEFAESTLLLNGTLRGLEESSETTGTFSGAAPKEDGGNGICWQIAGRSTEKVCKPSAMAVLLYTLK